MTTSVSDKLATPVKLMQVWFLFWNTTKNRFPHVQGLNTSYLSGRCRVKCITEIFLCKSLLTLTLFSSNVLRFWNWWRPVQVYLGAAAPSGGGGILPVVTGRRSSARCPGLNSTVEHPDVKSKVSQNYFTETGENPEKERSVNLRTQTANLHRVFLHWVYTQCHEFSMLQLWVGAVDEQLFAVRDTAVRNSEDSALHGLCKLCMRTTIGI